jgi:hypothetical protein
MQTKGSLSGVGVGGSGLELKRKFLMIFVKKLNLAKHFPAKIVQKLTVYFIFIYNKIRFIQFTPTVNIERLL